MTIGRLHKLCIVAVALLGAFGVMSGSVLTFVVGVGLTVSALYASRDLYATTRSKLRTWTVHGVTVALLIFAIAIFRSARIDAVLIVLMLGIFNRILLRNGHRDDLLILGAASVLLAATTTVTPGLGFALILLMFIPIGIWGLWTSMIIGAAEDSGGPGKIEAMRARPVPPRRWRMVMSAFALTFAGYALLSFLPRYQFSPFLAAGAFAGLPGAGDSMGMTTGGVTKQRDGTVVVRVEPQAGIDRGALHGIYARVHSLDQFDGKRWTTSGGGAFRITGTAKGGPQLKVSVLRMPTKRGRHHPVAAVGRQFPWQPSDIVRESLAGSWIVDRFRGRSFDYTLTVVNSAPDAALPKGWAVARNRKLTALPDDLDPRVRALADKLTVGITDPGARAKAILAHFETGEFEYSLSALEGDAPDPLVRFLFEAKKGHCELYAGALAVLLRAAGLQSRVATGYYNGDWNEVGGYLAFAQQDAHAWAEVHIPGRGWRWFDATPEDLRARGTSERSAFAQIRDVWDALDAAWYDYVVDYENEQTRNVWAAMAFRLYNGGATGAAKKAVEKITGKRPSGGALLLLVLFPIGLLIAARRLRQGRRPEYLGRRIRRALGERKHENTTLEALVKSAQGDVRIAAEQAIGRYERLRFSRAKGDKALFAEVRTAVNALELAVKRG